jgi:hypothetical protein
MSHKEQQEKPIIIDNTDKVLSWIDKALGIVKNYGITRILTTSLLVGIISIFFYFLFNPNTAFEIYERWREVKHSELMELRMENAPKIQLLLDRLTFKVDASRSMILELHNGSDGVGGLPFTKCSATYESLNISVRPVSSQYQNQNMSLIPFATFIFEKGYWCGHTEELLEIDRGLYYKMKSNKTEHFSACLIEGIDKALAILIVSFDKEPNELHDCDKVRENIRHVAMEIAVYLEVEKMIKNKTK